MVWSLRTQDVGVGRPQKFLEEPGFKNRLVDSSMGFSFMQTNSFLLL